MKKYVVTAITPATAEITVTAKSMEDAIDKAGDKIDFGEEMDFTVDVRDADDVELSVREFMPENDSKDPVEPEFNRYTVVLEASSVKEVPVKAVSPEAAAEMVRKMYYSSDVIDFTDADVFRVEATVVPDEADEAEQDAAEELMTGLVKLIRSTDAPDDVLGHMLIRSMREVFGRSNDEE